MEMTDYPELEKIKAAQPDSQKLGEFLYWLSEQGLQIAEYAPDEDGDDPRLTLHYESRESLLAKYFGIDLQKAEKERMAILEDLRKPVCKVCGEKWHPSKIEREICSTCREDKRRSDI